MSGLGRSPEVVAADLKKDAETAAIAKELGLSVDEYVAMVMEYARNPTKEPQLEIVPDEILLQMDPDERPATTEEVQAWLRKVNSGEIDLSPHEFTTKFAGASNTARESAAMALNGSKRALNVPEAATDEMPEDESARALKDQLRSQLDAVRKGPAGRGKSGVKNAAKSE